MKIDRHPALDLVFSCLFVLVSISGCAPNNSAERSGVNTLFVSATFGNDVTGDGSRSAPFRTITAAIAVVPDAGAEIDIDSGLYDAGLGEVFPINFPPGTDVVGSGSVDGGISTTLVSGSGVYASPNLGGLTNVGLVLSSDVSIRDLRIEAPGEIALVAEDSQASSLLNVAVAKSQAGLVAAGNSALRVQNSIFEDNPGSGIEILDFAQILLIGNTIRNNGIGIIIRDAAQPLFGGPVSDGNNSVLANSSCDLLHLGTQTLSLTGTRWDQDVYDFTVVTDCTIGANIVNQGIGSIDFQFVPVTTNPMFGSTALIESTAPSQGELLFTTDPAFVWPGVSNTPLVIAIWDEPPIITSGVIRNRDNIIWLWHSGLSRGTRGFVRYSDGIFPGFPDLAQSDPPAALLPGRSYYWAIWSWDARGISIERSSAISYFRTQP